MPEKDVEAQFQEAVASTLRAMAVVQNMMLSLLGIIHFYTMIKFDSQN